MTRVGTSKFPLLNISATILRKDPSDVAATYVGYFRRNLQGAVIERVLKQGNALTLEKMAWPPPLPIHILLGIIRNTVNGQQR